MSAIVRQGWLHPSTYPPPRGELILLKTRNGRAVIGKWEDEWGYLAWQYLPSDT